MSRYTSRYEHLGAWPVVALIDSSTGMAVRIARRGATVLDFLVPVGGELRNIADGYADADELEAMHSARFAIMLPFANRIADARYRFDGHDHDLQPGVEGAERGIRHGFVRPLEFELIAVDNDDTGVCARFGYNGVRPGAFPGYPFALDLEVAFTLHAGGLDLAVTMRNVGDEAAPCFFGWHPYLRVREDGINACRLQLPSRQAIVADERMIPLPGAAARKPLDACAELDFRQPRAIGTTVLDNGFADPLADADGHIRSHLHDPDSGLTVSMWQSSGITLAFSGDTLGAGAARRSLAIEPMEAMTDAFNRPDCAAAVRLDAGAERQFHCGLEIRHEDA